jgi:AraC-like DNA-binding protein
MSEMHLKEEIRFWRVPGWEQLELICGKRVKRECPRHWHDEIHMCVIEGGGGTLFYGGSNHETPAGSLFVVQPGETHGNYTRHSEGCSYRTLNITPETFTRLIFEVTGSDTYSFSMRSPVVLDVEVIHAFTKAHRTFEVTNSDLKRDSVLLELFAVLMTRHGEQKPALAKVGSERSAIKRVREYLKENIAENVLLKHLAQMANLSPFHLNRAFSLETGLPPHAYQTQLRIIQAKRLLQLGEPLSDVASKVGFADQSHFTRQFKRIVGTTPGQYSKNVQDFQPTVQLI